MNPQGDDAREAVAVGLLEDGVCPRLTARGTLGEERGIAPRRRQLRRQRGAERRLAEAAPPELRLKCIEGRKAALDDPLGISARSRRDDDGEEDRPIGGDLGRRGDLRRGKKNGERGSVIC